MNVARERYHINALNYVVVVVVVSGVKRPVNTYETGPKLV